MEALLTVFLPWPQPGPIPGHTLQREVGESHSPVLGGVEFCCGSCQVEGSYAARARVCEAHKNSSLQLTSFSPYYIQ